MDLLKNLMKTASEGASLEVAASAANTTSFNREPMILTFEGVQFNGVLTGGRYQAGRTPGTVYAILNVHATSCALQGVHPAATVPPTEPEEYQKVKDALERATSLLKVAEHGATVGWMISRSGSRLAETTYKGKTYAVPQNVYAPDPAIRDYFAQDMLALGCCVYFGEVLSGIVEGGHIPTLSELSAAWNSLSAVLTKGPSPEEEANRAKMRTKLATDGIMYVAGAEDQVKAARDLPVILYNARPKSVKDGKRRPRLGMLPDLPTIAAGLDGLRAEAAQ
jgi:hypothetical protein